MQCSGGVLREIIKTQAKCFADNLNAYITFSLGKVQLNLNTDCLASGKSWGNCWRELLKSYAYED